METYQERQLIQTALAGNSESLAILLNEVKDLTFNLSLRMLGNVFDAEDATQEILLKAITNLSSFDERSRFSTWFYRLATNHLINDHKKRVFREQMTFDFMQEDIEQTLSIDDAVFYESEEDELAEELKLSCTNIMLQCLNPRDRCIFIFVTMFKMNSNYASELLQETPDNYRKRLSRSREKMRTFLDSYCGLASGEYNCKRRVTFAIKQKRLNPNQYDYLKLKELDLSELYNQKENMDYLDEQTLLFEELSHYQSAFNPRQFLKEMLSTKQLSDLIKKDSIYDL